MAILTSLPGITVSVLTADSPAPLIEYRCDEDDPSIPAHLRHKTTTNYIQSAPGKEFSFKLNVGPPYLHDCPILAFLFVINGKDEGPYQLCSQDHLDDDDCWEGVVPGWEINIGGGRRKLFRFRFGELKTNEQNPSHLPSDEREALKKVGTLEVRVYRHKDSRIREPKQQILKEAIKEVPEKIVKGQAISHTVELGDGEDLEEETIFQNQMLMDGEEHPIGVFRFKYRSKEDLQKSWIIPRSPTPEVIPPSPPSPPAFEDLNDNDVNDLAKRGHGGKELLRRMLSMRHGEQYVPIEFESLSEDEKKKLAREEYVTLYGGPPVKLEPERVAQAVDALAGQKRKRVLKYTRLDNGKLSFDLTSDHEEDQTPSSAPVPAAKSLVEDDDDVVFMSARIVRKRRAETENAGNTRVKTEN